ncbi:MAG: protein-disulfide reductase DsbD domain-containing protein [Acidobacteriota bacterium]
MKEYGIAEGRRVELRNRHLTITAYASQDTVWRGSHISLVLDVETAPEIHVYAPDNESYLPVSFGIDDNSAVSEVLETDFPPAEIVDLPAIKERVPVYAGRFRITRDLIVSLEIEQPELELTGSFEYQACDEEFCYLPVKIPLDFRFEVKEVDSERVPESMRKPGTSGR